MYRIKYHNSTIFDPYDDDEVVTDAKLTQEVNAAAYLDFTISPKHPLYDTVKERDGVVTLEWLSNDDSEEDEKLFEGIIDAITIDFYGYKAISCVSAMDYLNDTIVRPYSTVAGEQALTAPSSIEGYFQWLIDQHNSHVLDPKKRFGVGINQGASMRRNDFIYRSSTGHPTTSEEISNQILETLGGYLVMRYENGNNVLDLYSDVHEMNAQIIDFGVNLLDFTKTIDTADQYTALIPQGGSPKFTDGGFEDDDSVWNRYPYLNISTDQKHSGDKSAYFTEGNGEFINSTFFYVREGYRYKSTVWVKNERSSAIKVYPRYQVFVGSVWETRTPDGVNPLEVPNDNEWHEFTFDFLPHVSETTKIRPYWVFDSVANDANKRVYVDDFNFVRIQGDQELEEDPITVSQMGDGTTQFSYDIVKYHDVVYSLDAVQRYGYREKVFSDDTITDEDALMQEAIRQLNMVMSPTTGIDIKAIDLAMFMKGYKHLQVGQAVRIRSKFHDTDEYLMVSSVDLDLQDPSQTEYELGKAYDSLTGQQSGFLMSLNSGINSSLDAVASLDQTTKDQAIQIGSVEQVANQAQQTADQAQQTADAAQETANSNKESISDLQDQQSEQDKLIEQMQQGIDESEKEIDAINDRIDQMDTEAGEVQAAIDAVRQEAQSNFETAKNAADAAGQRADAAQEAVDSLRESTSSELQNVKDSVSGVRSDVDAVTQKAADLASELDGTKATVEQVVTEQGEIKSSVSNAVEKADQSLKVSTQASQTATQAQTTATSAYEDAQTAITQSSQATQTANQVSLELRTNYQTKADADAKYATQASLTATSEQIRTEVSETYATQATVNALENLANNAVQTWMGEGVPSLSNKPASDWTTSELRKQHSGDLYYDTNTGYAYRFGSSDGTSYSWALVKDTDITKALADAAKAQETAEGAQSGVNELKTSIPVTYATKSELSQKADSITARVEEVAQAGETTSSKVAELELTADGLQSTVKEQASKIDQNTTTISQVSQKADSLSSTITQVSGRVDDVDTKADTAQGTANSALSQASRVEQSLDSFKTSVSRDYQTKTDAFSQKSELEQNINSFKTTVSETYTTKDEFNALEIGGTNLLPNTGSSKGYGTSAGRSDLTVGTDDIRGEYYRRSTTGTSEVFISSNRTTGIDDGEYTVSFWYRVNQYVKNVDVFWLARSVDSSADFDTSGGAKIVVMGLNPQDNTWTYWSGTFTAISGKPNGYIRIDNNGSSTNGQAATLDVTQLKLERGNKPTAWSPAPEDFDGKYTSKTEFKQTTDKISATATAASQNASSALSKVSSLEVSVDGIDTRVEEVASDADEAVKTASQVSQRVDSLSSIITQVSNKADALADSLDIMNPGFESGDLTGWTTSNYKETRVNTESVHSGVYKFLGRTAGNISCGLVNDSVIPVVEGQRYRIEADLWPDGGIEAGSIEFGYTDQNGTITSPVFPTFSTGYWNHCSGEFTIPSGVTSIRVRIGCWSKNADQWLRIDNVKITNVTDIKTATDTANSALSKSSSVEQSLNSFKTSVSQTYETKSDASSKQSSLQQSVNNLRTEVSQTYTTKTDVANNYTPKIVAKNTGTGGQTGWFRVAQFKVTATYSNAAHRITVTNRLSQQTVINIQMKSINGTDPGLGTLTKSGPATVAMAKSATSTWILYVQKSEAYDSLTVTSYEVPSYNPMTVTWLTDQVSAPPSGYTTATNLIGWKNETDYSTKSYVDQTSRTVSLGVVEEYKNGQHGSALATQSDITATKNEITSTVSQTYLTKNSASSTYLTQSNAAAQYATKTQVQQTSDSLTVKISESINMVEIGGTNIARDTKAFGHNHVSSTEEGYLRSYVNRTNGTYKGLTVRNIVSSDGIGQVVCDYLVTNVRHSEYYTLSFWAKGSGIIRTYFYGPGSYISAKRVSSSDGQGASDFGDGSTSMTLSSGWKRYWVVYQTNSSGGSSTDKYMLLRNDNDMASCDVCGVMIERGNKASEWSASPLDADAESSAAQSTANTANANAQNAQNRVGNLETCIKMTAQGVRVGKVSNGNFTGYSALVNSAGSFDILNGSGAAITRFTSYGMEIPSANNGNRDAKFVLTSSGYELSFVRNGTTYYFRLGSGGIGIHASDGSYVDVGSGGLAIHTNNGNYVDVSPNGTSIKSSDGSYIAMSKNSGFTLDSKAFGKLVCGSNGLQFTNDQGWGLLLSAAGWSLKWAGNHTLATGNEAGALYIDGRKIQVA